MSKPYLPTSDSALQTWAQDFADLVVANPTTYGVSVADAEDLGTKLAAFSAALATATNPNTRTTPAVQAKNDAKKALIAAIRPIVRTIQAFPGTTDAMRAQLKITIRDTDPTPVPVPDSSPALSVVAVMGRKIKVTLRKREDDGEPSTSRARPDGVRGANVFFAAGDTFPDNLEGWSFKGTVAKTTFDLTIPDSVPAGSKVYLTAQWFNTRNETGPACPPVETRIAGGLSQAA